MIASLYHLNDLSSPAGRKSQKNVCPATMFWLISFIVIRPEIEAAGKAGG